MTKANTHSKNFFSKRRDILVCMFLVLSTLSVYWQVHNYDFVNFDDDKYVSDNRHVQVGLTLESITWAFTTNHVSNWHPLTWLSHMLDCQFYGINPGRHHLTNLLFHIANTLLLFFVFRKMTGHLWQSTFVASLFALHPLHVESVAWISERKDVLSTFFWLLTMWSYILYVQHPRVDKYLLVLLFFILGLMAKPMLVTLPFVLLLLDFYPLYRFHKSADSNNSYQRPIVFRLVLEKIPLFVLVVMSSAMTFYAQKHGGSVASLDTIPIQARIANALVSYVYYILKMIYPSKLAVLYPHSVILPWWQVTGACLLLLSISFLAIRVIKQSPYFVVGWLWYLGTLVPVIGLVQVGSQSMADRYTYIPLIGIFIIIIWSIAEFVTRWNDKKIILPTIATAILFVFMTITFLQVGYWENSITLFEHTLEVTSNNRTAHNNLGLALQEQGRIDDAIKHYLEALRIKPDYEDAHNNLGLALQEQGRIDDAIKHYLEALRIKPDYEDAHSNLGVALREQGRIDDAIKHYLEALRIKPDLEEAHNNLGIALQEQGRIDDAIKHYLEALRIKPDYGETHYNLGNALKEQGRIDDAIKHYLEALRIMPDYEDAHNNLAIALFHKGDIDGAIDHFRKALQINPNYIHAKNNLKKALMLQKQRQ
jgi:tetratricopeptide (TPR) repeat protein